MSVLRLEDAELRGGQIGHRLREELKRQGMSIRRLHSLVNKQRRVLSAETVRKYVNGTVAAPQARFVALMAKALGVHEAWLANGKGARRASQRLEFDPPSLIDPIEQGSDHHTWWQTKIFADEFSRGGWVPMITLEMASAFAVACDDLARSVNLYTEGERDSATCEGKSLPDSERMALAHDLAHWILLPLRSAGFFEADSSRRTRNYVMAALGALQQIIRDPHEGTTLDEMRGSALRRR